MIELLEASADFARDLAAQRGVALEVLQADFYEIELPQRYEALLYFDSFGIGSDEDQQRLLRRIANWLTPNGQAIVEVGTPWYWSGVAKGRRVDLEVCLREYDFEVQQSRLIDRWWRNSQPETVLVQSLRCYSPADLKLLLHGTGLELTTIRAGNTIDFEPLRLRKNVSLAEAMTYYAVLKRKTH